MTNNFYTKTFKKKKDAEEMTLSLGRLLDAEVVSKVRTMILQFFHAFFF